jgi:hypothetical protein
LLAFPADVRVTAAIDVAKIEPGQIVRVQTRLNSRGAATGEVATLTVVDAASAEIGVAWDAEAPRTAKDMTACTVTAPVTRASRKRITVELPAGTPFKAKTLVVENQASTAVRDRGDAALENTSRGLSAEPLKEPRLVRSRHFAFRTDVSDREWAMIRDKLERMVGRLGAAIFHAVTLRRP